ncbi:aconitate hydratase 1 [Longilinea arvoryzae]|uniref:Aconitate hydratase n=1 Tax=Longilinea arvoryzae TaxID=360412 RepID=A0A0S7BJJ8_9CHLR|nr:aconitate hydratase AcnA [Longilinea arvoryzae]GAP14488.1 aconitate hydratase 1 [Longilinea arvoryzae]
MIEKCFDYLRRTLSVDGKTYTYYSLDALEKEGFHHLRELPYSIRILLEALLRKCGSVDVTLQDALSLANWQPQGQPGSILTFHPGRVLLQDLTGVPILVDLAAMRSAVARAGGDPAKVNPVIPVDLVIDHSIQVDFFGLPDAAERNTAIEFERNAERYRFLRWAQKAFQKLRVVPPATGICHQVNLEMLSSVALTQPSGGDLLVFPDTLVGTDSHTTMVNGLGVLGWGVGGIEAAAALLGHALEMPVPQVIGVHLTGALAEGVTPFDLTLTIAQVLRQKGVVNRMVEFYGPGLASLSLADRAMIANMSPEYGSTAAYFPVDAQTLAYLRLTGRSDHQVALVEAYFRAQHLFRLEDSPDPVFSDQLELDMGSIEPSLAGPKRPQDRIALKGVKQRFEETLAAPRVENGYELAVSQREAFAEGHIDGKTCRLEHGSVVIAAITSCTNTSDPFVLVAAGLLAKNAVARGLTPPDHVKTSFTPGSRVVTEYLSQAGLLEPLAALGFGLAGYGCATCIGNSGPLPGDLSEVIKANGLVTAAVISGNRNFEGRVHPSVQANFLASPPLVVAYALAGNVKSDITREPLGKDRQGKPVYLRELMPTAQEIQRVIDRFVQPALFRQNAATSFQGNQAWKQIDAPESLLYEWEEGSTYIQEPPFLEGMDKPGSEVAPIQHARVLAVFGDSITTDHISPAGAIPVNSPAGKYLLEHGVKPVDFNSYGARRGNDQVMVRGTFANIRLKNRLVPGVEGGFTRHLPDDRVMTIFEAAEVYRQEGVPLVILAGKEYGTGSSRDWAAKGPLLLGVRAVVAESFERIHRSNLVGMGILPLQFQPGENVASLALSGDEILDIDGLENGLTPGMVLEVRAVAPDGREVRLRVKALLNSLSEVEYLRSGGILKSAVRRLLD